MDNPRILARIQKSERAEIRVQVGTWRGKVVLDIREWYGTDAEARKPGYRGFGVDPRFAGQLADALAAGAEAIKDPQATQASSDAPGG